MYILCFLNSFGVVVLKRVLLSGTFVFIVRGNFDHTRKIDLGSKQAKQKDKLNVHE